MQVGLDESEARSAFNIVPQDILRKLPGVTPHNVVYIMNHVESLAELSKLPLERLKQLAGDANGERLHAFLHATAPSSLSIPQFTFEGGGSAAASSSASFGANNNNNAGGKDAASSSSSSSSSVGAAGGVQGRGNAGAGGAGARK
jgi:hypothetical protein